MAEEHEMPPIVADFLNEVSQETEYKELPPLEPEPQEIVEEPIQVDTDKVDTSEKPSVSGNLQAKFYLSMFETTLQTGLGFAHRNKLKKKVGANKVDIAFDNWSNFKDGTLAKEDLSPEQKNQIRSVDKFVKNYEKLPLTEDEKQMFIESLSEIIEENDYKMPPTLAITMVLFNATFTRTVDYIFD